MASLLLGVIYLAFISLGLPDSLLGAAWPAMHQDLGAGLSWSGVIFMIISAGTIASSLLSDRLTRRFGAGCVTAVSVAVTCAALLGFSLCRSFALLCLCAIPYGLGAGGVDAALNNYVALHYASRHMSWLHCMWGIGATVGPYIMGAALSGGYGWSMGYRTVALIQVGLTGLLFLSLPLWNKEKNGGDTAKETTPAPLRKIAVLPGARAVMLCFFCYCAAEQTVGLWASSYLVTVHGLNAAAAARFASLFFLGVTAGRALSGFLTLRLNDVQMVRLGLALFALGLIPVLLPLGDVPARAGLMLVGLGCAPVYPSMIHATPSRFGPERSQALIGLQMASAYVGTTLMPPLFGYLAARTSLRLFPAFLLILLLVMAASHERLCRRTA